jgi:hypothetical protein
MKFNPKGLIVAAAFFLFLWAAFATHEEEAIDNLLSIALLVFVTVTSTAVVVARIRGRDAFGHAGVLREIQRWFSRH